MSFEHWDEVRTAYQVARIGTVSGAAEVLGVHHATVIRHIDALEGRLGAKLFQRHARGYTPTEAGQDLLIVAASTDDQFTQLAGRIKGRGNEVTGDLVVTSLGSISPLFVPAMAAFQKEHPDLTIRLLTDERLFRLEYGEAHVAIRAGKAGDNPDNIVQPFFTQNIRLVAHADYVAEYGLLDEKNLDHHRFIGSAQDRSREPFFRWMSEMVPEGSIVYRTSDLRGMKDAVLAGIGIGIVASWDRFGTEDLVEMLPSLEEWAFPLWLVTHMDLHRTAKVQTFLQFLKEQVKTWDLG
jgi:DNA-binding transcriptional LysR family regulator